MTFGDRVKKYRELRQMSQSELAKRAGYTSRSTISKIESGDRDVPQATIKALADALGVMPSALVFDTESSELSEDEVQKDILWRAYSQLSDADRRTVFLLIERLAGVKLDG